jgi:hypothetical protein
VCTSSDAFLQEFHQQFERTFAGKVGEVGSDEDDDDSDDDNDGGDIVVDDDDVANTRDCRLQDDVESGEVQEPAQEQTGKLRIFNLPFGVDLRKLLAVGLERGLDFLHAALNMDPHTGQHLGTADVELVRGVDAETAAHMLHGAVVDGRPVRANVLRSSNLNADLLRRRAAAATAADNNRYFGGGSHMNIKCNNCGAVGHKAVACTAPPMITPCHLCAGRDHDAGDCPNITCFRCGEFGHHSKHCRNPRRYSRATICSQCASATHDVRHCATLPERALARMEDSATRCMSCNGLGHALCKRVAAPATLRDGKVFCPNCGLEGHHVDYPADYLVRNGAGSTGPDAFPQKTSSSSNGGGGGGGGGEALQPYMTQGLNPCQAPKQDAYIKFPELFRYACGAEAAFPSERGYRNAAEFYQTLLRNSGQLGNSSAVQDQVQSMFPCLCKVTLKTKVENSAPSASSSSASSSSSSRTVHVDVLGTGPNVTSTRGQSAHPQHQHQHEDRQRHQHQDRQYHQHHQYHQHNQHHQHHYQYQHQYQHHEYDHQQEYNQYQQHHGGPPNNYDRRGGSGAYDHRRVWDGHT